ncbi:MAG: phage tail protein [Atopobiaceae bacterium]|nr:phage tail protein [Atopobiaceae bacterium]
MAPRILVYSHLDEPLFELDPSRLSGLKMVEEVNGEHSLTVATSQALEKGQRLIYADGRGKVREFVVVGGTSTDAAGESPHTYYGVWSLQYDLSGAYITDRHVGSGDDLRGVEDALVAVTSACRWDVGTVDSASLSSARFYYESAWDALSKTVEAWGVEVDATIVVGETVARRLDAYAHQGEEAPSRRFEYAHDMSSITRTVLDDLFVCRIIPRGKGEQVGEASADDPTYGRRIDITSVNGGIEWLQDDEAATAVRVPNGNGFDYPSQVVVYESIETPEALLEAAQADLQSYTRPKVSYEADVVRVGDVGLGDAVQVVDRAFCGEGLRIEARAMGIERDLLDPSRDRVTVGNFRHSLADTFRELSNGLSAVKEQLVETDGKAGTALDGASSAALAAQAALEVAVANGQHFWDDGGGAHITEATREEWEDTLGPLHESGPNSLWNSQGMLFRDGLANLLALFVGGASDERGMAVFDGNGNGSENIVARFTSSGVQIGSTAAESYIVIADDGMAFYSDGAAVASASSDGFQAPEMTVDSMLHLGRWAIIPRSNDNLAIKWIG